MATTELTAEEMALVRAKFERQGFSIEFTPTEVVVRKGSQTRRLPNGMFKVGGSDAPTNPD